MNDTVQQAARATAVRMAPEYGRRLPAEVEAALHSPDGIPQHEQYDPVSIGGLIVAVATLAYTVYQDHKKKHNEQPSTQVFIRTVRIELNDNRVSGQLSVEQRDQLIQTVVEEITRAVDNELDPPQDQ